MATEQFRFLDELEDLLIGKKNELTHQLERLIEDTFEDALETIARQKTALENEFNEEEHGDTDGDYDSEALAENALQHRIAASLLSQQIGAQLSGTPVVEAPEADFSLANHIIQQLNSPVSEPDTGNEILASANPYRAPQAEISLTDQISQQVNASSVEAARSVYRAAEAQAAGGNPYGTQLTAATIAPTYNTRPVYEQMPPPIMPTQPAIPTQQPYAFGPSAPVHHSGQIHPLDETPQPPAQYPSPYGVSNGYISSDNTQEFAQPAPTAYQSFPAYPTIEPSSLLIPSSYWGQEEEAELEAEEAPVVAIAPSLSLDNLIKSQVGVVAAPVNLAEQIKAQMAGPVDLSALIEDQILGVQAGPVVDLAQQIAEQLPADTTIADPAYSDGPVAKPEPTPRALHEIIAELRLGVNQEVENVSFPVVEKLADLAAAQTEPQETGVDLSRQILTQLVSTEIKKQLS